MHPEITPPSNFYHLRDTTEIGPHPELSESQKKVIALDYGMRDGQAKIPVRQGGSVAERKKMIDPTAKLSVSRQAIVLGISRGSIYYLHRTVSDADLKLMHRTHKLHMEFPLAGSGGGWIVMSWVVMDRPAV